MHALWLPSFPTRADEDVFWQRHDTRRFAFRKFFMLCAIILYSGLGILDIVAGGESTPLLLCIRAASVVAVTIVTYFFCRPQTAVMREILLSLFGIVVIASGTVMTLVGPASVAETYPFIISAAMIYGHSLFLPRFYTQAAFCAMVALIYWPTTVFAEMPLNVYLTNAFVIWITTVSVLIGSLVRERLQREHAINEVNLSRAMDEALRANRAKSNLLANVSHELRTPLNAIVGFSEMMDNEIFGRIEQDAYRQYIRDIHFSGKLLHANIDDLLDLSRLDVDKMHWNEEYVSIPETLQRVITTCEPQEKSINVALSSRFQHVNMTMLTDADRLNQVFINIITNAMKFSEPGTTVCISFSVEADGTVVLRIADQGIGISREDLKRIHEPFNQAKRSSYVAANTGLGLGLAIVSGILERCDSTFTIESELGVGTTVSIRIPSDRIAVSAIQKPRSASRAMPRQIAS